MSDTRREIVVSYPSAAEAARALKRLRRYGLRSPSDHVIVEGARAALVVLPIALAAAGAIRFDHAIAAYCGYFALRWFNAFVKPALLRRFGPRLPASDLASALTMIFDAEGVRSQAGNAEIRLKWRALPPHRVFSDGVILRIAPEQSFVVAAAHLPEGMTMEAFARQVDTWRAEAVR